MATVVRMDRGLEDNNIASIKFESDLENGQVVILGDMDADGTYTATAPADAATDLILLHISVPVMYEVEKGREEDFILETGRVGRAFYLKQGDILTITDDGINGTTVLNQYCIPADGATKLVPSATIGTTVLSLKVIAKETLAGKTATVLEVVKA
ncbi:MAG: hypothetical protein GY714_23505 [Desulfobacterales bacterium]|nr:hypothetical protein [Desulfobacterales bacterium]